MRTIVTLGADLAGRQAGNIRQRAIVTSGGRRERRHPHYVCQAVSNHHLRWQTCQVVRLAMLVRQRAIVTLGGRLVGRHVGCVSQAESNSHPRWQTDRQTGWQC